MIGSRFELPFFLPQAAVWEHLQTTETLYNDPVRSTLYYQPQGKVIF